MGKPAARVGDNHICPMIDGPKPHVGGPILPPGKPTVLIGGLPAATMGNMCTCVSPLPDTIMQGSPTVLIGGLPAARLFDMTMHGGSIAFGAGTVLIGEFAAVSTAEVFPGKQHYNNCGLQSSEQLIHQATGKHLGEDDMLLLAVAGGFADSPTLDDPGGSTTSSTIQDLLSEFGVNSTVINSPNEQELAEALKENKGVIAGVESATLWGTTRRGGHAVVITEGDFDEHGKLTHVYINDTGSGQQGRRMTTEEILKSLNDFKHPTLNVTDQPIWTKIR